MITRYELQQKLKELLVLSGRRWSCSSYGTPTQLDECIKNVDDKTSEILDAFDEMVSELAVNLADIVDLKCVLQAVYDSVDVNSPSTIPGPVFAKVMHALGKGNGKGNRSTC